MSDNDIIISAEDRIAPATAAADTVRTRPAASRRKADEPRQGRGESKPKGKSRRRIVWPRMHFTPLQKLSAAGLAGVAVVAGGALFWHSGVLQQAGRDTTAAIMDATGKAGFRIDQITVAGRSTTTMEQLAQALGAGYGAPIFSVDLDRVKARIESLPSVKQAAVERVLPNMLHIAVNERTPIAVWQNNGEYVLVDKDGQVIPGSPGAHADLPLVVGDGAGARADELLAMLAGEPTLAARVKAAVRVGNRRWNVMLDDAEQGLEIRLPEEAAEAAWTRLADLERSQGLSARRLSMIDLRVPDRMILKTERPSTGADGAKRKDNGA